MEKAILTMEEENCHLKLMNVIDNSKKHSVLAQIKAFLLGAWFKRCG